MGKWNGKSLYQLDLKAKRIAALTTAIHELDDLRLDAERAHREELGRLIGRDGNDLVKGPWKCNGSPTGLCVYDMSTDEQDDECLFCTGPRERK